MTNAFKKSISIIISFALLVSVFALSEISAFAKNNEYEYYSADNKTIMIAQYTGTKTKITVPDKIGNKKVTVISGLGSKVKEVTIGKNITHIEDFAFIDAKSLKKITVNKNNKNYSSKDGILYNKKGTKLLVYPASKSGEKFISSKKVTSIGNNAFTNSKNLKSIDISLCKNVGAGVFYNSKALKSVKLPKSLKNFQATILLHILMAFSVIVRLLKLIQFLKISPLSVICALQVRDLQKSPFLRLLLR